MNGVGLRHLRCFLETARLSSVGAAADALAISQPAVSKTLRELEMRLGVTLFERAGRGLRLTSAGRQFQTHAGLALTELRRGIRLLQEDKARRDPLAIGALPTVSTAIMPAAALKFSRQEPHTPLRITTGPNWMLLSQLREGALELVVGRIPAPEAMKGLIFEQLIIEPIIVAARPHHPILSSPERGLCDFPLILPPPDAVIRPAVEAYFHSLGQETPFAPIETVSLAIGRALVIQSDALWFISRGVIGDELQAGRLIAFDPPGSIMPGGPVGLTRRAGEEASAPILSLMEALRQTARLVANSNLGPS